MKNSKLRRVLLLLACAVLLVSLSVGATLAYLTHETGVVENTFTVGNVYFDDDPETDLDEGLDEATVDAEGNPVDAQGNKIADVNMDAPATWANAPRVNENEYKLLPGHRYVKDPVIHVADDSEEAWLFVKVVNGIAPIETTNETITIEQQMIDQGWVKLTGYADYEDVWYWKWPVTAGADVTVFTTFTINAELKYEDLESYGDATITVQAYMVQKDGINNQEDAWYFAPYTPWKTVTETPDAGE